MKFPFLQYITHSIEDLAPEDQALQVLEAGAEWIQFRHKGQLTHTVLEEAQDIKMLCETFDAKLIVNDHIDLAQKIGAAGVHLGQNDRPIAEAREALGPNAIIGATANTMQEALKAIDEGADYIGFGPYRATNTKKDHAEPLNIEPYAQLIQTLRMMNKLKPVYAIGGIELNDIEALMATGIQGVAVSSAIHSSSNLKQTTESFINSLNQVSHG